MKLEETGTIPRRLTQPEGPQQKSAVLLPLAPPGSVDRDRHTFSGALSIGRDCDCGLTILDNMLSRLHLCITTDGRQSSIEDLGSKNGTFVNGRRIKGATRLPDKAVIRAGRVLLVFHEVATSTGSANEPETHGIVGRFHATKLVTELSESARSERNLLLAGPSGSGKELAARAVAQLLEREMLAHNAARFSSEEEAMTTLFGVGRQVFSNVRERTGYVEQADGGILFLDEVHILPPRVQKSLLRVIEDRQAARIGETTELEVDVRFVLASNEPPPSFGLVEDLLTRLRVVRIPSLRERLADIPSIFLHLLEKALTKVKIDIPLLHELLSVDHYESLLLDGFAGDNVRGLLDLADRIATRIGSDAPPQEAVNGVFTERYHTRYPDPPLPGNGVTTRITEEIPLHATRLGSEYQLIEFAYAKTGGNVTAIQRELKKHGIDYSRKRISNTLDRMRLPRIKRKRK